MDNLVLWVAGAFVCLLIVYWIICAIVNKIKEPYESKSRLIDSKKAEENYIKLAKEAEIKISEAEEAIRQQRAAKAEESRYLSLKQDLVTRYNHAMSELDKQAEEKALIMLAPSDWLLTKIAPECNIDELHQSIIEGKLFRAFSTPPSIIGIRLEAQIKSPNDIYTTTLENCTCKDFQCRKKPCKHMLYLYYTIGILNIDKPLNDKALNALNGIISEINENKISLQNLQKTIRTESEAGHRALENLKAREYILEKDIKELRQEKNDAADELAEFERIIKDKHSYFPQVSKIITEYQVIRYEHASHWLVSKRPPARSAAETVTILKHETKEYLKELNELRLKFAYLEDMFPNINDIFEPGVNSENDFELETKENTDRVRFYLSPDEYNNLSTTEKNQLALDRYLERRKSNWQIGRDYEMSVGYLIECESYNVQYTGIVKNLEDMGRDLIAIKENKTLIVQCKNWSQEKTIHEKHIFQLYGTVVLYKLDNPYFDAKGVFITTTKLSEKARAVANVLDIKIVEQFSICDFPRIKCNINRTTGERIYHLPFDQQYDHVVIEKDKGECYAFTVKEAEDKGFRRAWKHYI